MRLAKRLFGHCALLCALCLAAAAAAQPCEERAAGSVGGWIEGTDTGGSGSPATARNKAAIRDVQDRIAALVRQAYPAPTGSQGKLSRDFGVEPFGGADDATYGVTAQFKGYGCDRRQNPEGEVHLYGETATWLRIQVNSFWPGDSRVETPQFFLSTQDHEGLVTLTPRSVLRTPQPGHPDRKPIADRLPAAFDAYPHFTFEQAYDSTDYSYNRRVVYQVVFVTPDGALPYVPVTIGEFLDVNEQRLRRYIDENRQYYEMDAYEELLARIPVLRQRYGARLGDTAHLRDPSWSEDRLKDADPFVDAKSGHMVARRSGHLLAGGGSWKPRFMTLVWSWQPESDYSVRVHRALSSGLDLEALRALLAG